MYIILLLLFALTGCNDSSSNERIEAEYIYRLESEKSVPIFYLKPKAAPSYPWQKGSRNTLLRPITKEYFRCKGNSLHPVRIVKDEEQEKARYHDCGGAEKHSLPLRNNQEFIYPILIEIVNYIQEVSKKPVTITSGHRCPDHNMYIDEGAQNSATKHMIGAATDFYVSGFEARPEAIVKIIQEFYKTNTRYQKQKEYLEFKRFDKKSNVSIAPWYNKEIFIKIFKANEGRNIDNRHPYPYISLQVRFDYERNLAVNFNWEQAQQFLRK